jgi:lipopolysaccharide export system protein LptA
MRALVIAAGVLLIAALGIFLTIGKFRHRFKLRDLPQKLGLDIQQEGSGYTYAHALGAHSQYKIHASKEVVFKDNRVELHEVLIELYSDDGKRVDRIAGDEFNYDKKAGTATAVGPVEITLMRPAPEQAEEVKEATPKDKKLAKDLAPVTADHIGPNDVIHVKTSGLSFNQNTGVATTAERVNFSTAKASGSSIGATYDSQQGFLVLDRSVELAAKRNGEPVTIHAVHLEFTRDTEICRLQAATAEYRGGQASAAEARVQFREDGTAEHFDALGGFNATTANGGHLQAPKAAMDLDLMNQPRHGRLEGGVVMDSVNGARTVHGTSPTAEIAFTPEGELRHAHLERGVTMESAATGEQMVNGRQVNTQVSRTWRSPVADVDFRDAGKGQVEPATIHGFGGVTIDSSTQRGDAPPQPSKLSAEDVSGEFGTDSELESITGTGHASMERTSANGAWQSASGDRLEAQLEEDREHATPASKDRSLGTPAGSKGTRERGSKRTAGADEVQSATIDGHVVLLQRPASKPGGEPKPEMRATSGHATYEGDGQWLYLTVNPRVVDGGMELTAGKIDVTQASGDAFAQGNVKATWTNTKSAINQASQNSVALGGQEPGHAIANEAHLNQSTGIVEFDGKARLWQDANSVEGPVIVLDRDKRTLTARSMGAAAPVTAVLLSVGNAAGRAQSGGGEHSIKPAASSVIRVTGGDLVYSDIERRAQMNAGQLGAVTAKTGTAVTTSDKVELQLAPATGQPKGQSQVETMTASGHVVVTSQGRRGTGEKLEYTGATGNYVLTGTPGALPRMSDPERGTATGEALIFNSRDDSVSIEGGGHETETQTTAPKLRLGTEPGNEKGTQHAGQPRGQHARKQQGSGSEPDK